MIKPVYFNAATCFIVSFAAMSVVVLFFRKSAKDPDISSAAWFWALMSGLWFFAGLRQIFFAAGNLDVDRGLFFVTQIFVPIHLIPAAYNLTYKVFTSKKTSSRVSIFYMLLSMVFVYLLLRYGVSGPIVSQWGSKYAPSNYIFSMLMIPYIPLVFLILFDLGRRVFIWFKHRVIIDLDKFFMTLSFFVYAISGILDEKGAVVGWQLMLIRIFLVASVLLAYLSISAGEYKERKT